MKLIVDDIKFSESGYASTTVEVGTGTYPYLHFSICTMSVSVPLVEGKTLEQYKDELLEKARERIASMYREIVCDGQDAESLLNVLGGKIEPSEIQASLDRRLAVRAHYNAKVDASQGDWTLGASRALDNFLAQGSNVAGMTENVFTNAFNGMADGIANFALTGKMDFRSFTVSILADLAKMEARIAASKLLGSVLDMFGFGASAGGSTSRTLYRRRILR